MQPLARGQLLRNWYTAKHFFDDVERPALGLDKDAPDIFTHQSETEQLHTAEDQECKKKARPSLHVAKEKYRVENINSKQRRQQQERAGYVGGETQWRCG